MKILNDWNNFYAYLWKWSKPHGRFNCGILVNSCKIFAIPKKRILRKKKKSICYQHFHQIHFNLIPQNYVHRPFDLECSFGKWLEMCVKVVTFNYCQITWNFPFASFTTPTFITMAFLCRWAVDISQTILLWYAAYIGEVYVVFAVVVVATTSKSSSLSNSMKVARGQWCVETSYIL